MQDGARAMPEGRPSQVDDDDDEDEDTCPCDDPLLGPMRALLEPLLRRARDGQLTHAEAVEMASGQLAERELAWLRDARCSDCFGHISFLNHAANLSRGLYQGEVSWFLFSSEWLDALALLLKSRGHTRVLEVAAGSGVLAAPMRHRGLSWRTTDARPASTGPTGDEPPEACDALSAVARHGDATDVVFWSWWPRDDAGDAALAAECAARGVPVVFVGEPAGGLTGSAELWERSPDPRPLAELTLPCWPGLRDCTWAVGQL